MMNRAAEERPFQRILQGNESGPITWAAINILIVNVQKKKGYGIKFITVISKRQEYLFGFIFIDDTNLREWNLRPLNDTFEELCHKIQKAIN